MATNFITHVTTPFPHPPSTDPKLLSPNDPMPSMYYAVFHLFLVVSCGSYFFVGLRLVPAEIVNDSDIITKYQTYTRCCSNIHVALGPSAWFFPPLFIVYVMYQYSSPYHWNQEGTKFWGIVLEYLVGVIMAAIANRVYPIRSLRPREAFERTKNLVWDRWGERREERIQDGFVETINSVNNSTNNSREGSRNQSRA